MKKAPALKNLWYDIASPPNFLAIIDEEGLVIHDPSFYNFTSCRNLCVRSDTGRSCGANPFSSPRHPAACASRAAAII